MIMIFVPGRHSAAVAAPQLASSSQQLAPAAQHSPFPVQPPFHPP